MRVDAMKDIALLYPDRRALRTNGYLSNAEEVAAIGRFVGFDAVDG